MCGIRWWISSGAGRRRPRSAPADSFIGWASLRASSTTGGSAMGGRMSTTVGCPEIFGWSRGEGSHHRLPPEESIGRLSATYVHDVRSRCGGRESGERMASVETSGTPLALETEAVAQGDRLRIAAAAAPALARRCFLYQPVGHVLLLMQCAGWIQSFSGALGFAGVDEGSRH